MSLKVVQELVTSLGYRATRKIWTDDVFVEPDQKRRLRSHGMSRRDFIVDVSTTILIRHV